MCNKNQDVHLSSLLPLQYFFSAEDVKSRIYPSLDAIFFFPLLFHHSCMDCSQLKLYLRTSLLRTLLHVQFDKTF